MIQTYSRWVTVTPSDTVDLPQMTQALFIGGAGDLAAVQQNGVAGVIPSVPAGWMPIACKRINATGTTATKIVALYQV